MFTGLIQAMGQVNIGLGGVAIRNPDFLATVGPRQGDSIAVDGVCLTVARLEPWGFQADVSPETMARSTMGHPKAARAMVNLEPALRLQDRLGGHLVSGHVDGLGEITAIERQPRSWNVDIRWQDPVFGKYTVSKGSVAVDGISLTVARCSAGGERFSAAVIPVTWGKTTLQYRQVGDWVNLEADLLAKYSERLLGLEPPQPISHQEQAINKAWLQEQGWS
ncbi:riboflavin synthase [Candidatus Synechococcus spongiarum]|uniref:Riboflavin synthase n=2 Tax=Candidatus Synechococcus spongiarum TaxID=431041 RepID=A0A1T1D4F4_9SYNE|nr:riboflavin synthase [Candidatus Synechococcus spongiarum]OOV35503.1 riboflavin synthase [Candidatus Synechococcus spongiarum LMB bulk15M]OOV35707.1 riboflavin synthase [Candidatus Synechococcus spongiarum LMB bulk15N]